MCTYGYMHIRIDVNGICVDTRTCTSYVYVYECMHTYCVNVCAHGYAHVCVCVCMCMHACTPVWIKCCCTLVTVTIRCLATPTRDEQDISLVTTASQGGALNGGPRTQMTGWEKVRQTQGRPMTLLEHMASPASLLPVATCCYTSVLWPEAYRKKAGVGDTGNWRRQRQLNKYSGTCLYSVSFQDRLLTDTSASHRHHGQGADSHRGHLGPCLPPQGLHPHGHSSCVQ